MVVCLLTFFKLGFRRVPKKYAHAHIAPKEKRKDSICISLSIYIYMHPSHPPPTHFVFLLSLYIHRQKRLELLLGPAEWVDGSFPSVKRCSQGTFGRGLHCTPGLGRKTLNPIKRGFRD